LHALSGKPRIGLRQSEPALVLFNCLNRDIAPDLRPSSHQHIMNMPWMTVRSNAKRENMDWAQLAATSHHQTAVAVRDELHNENVAEAARGLEELKEKPCDSALLVCCRQIFAPSPPMT
jgi:hypothetical protein